MHRPTSYSPKYGEGRDALLAAVVRIVSRKGLRGLTYRAVANEAGVNNTLISHHFGSRAALIEEALRWAAENSIRLSKLDDESKFDESFVENIIDMTSLDPDLQAFQYEMILESRRTTELQPMVSELYSNYIQVIRARLLKQGHPISLPMARVIFAALDGLVVQHLTVADALSIRSALVALEELLQGLPKGE